MSVTIIVFAYNEEASLEEVVQELFGELRSLETNFEIVFVDDGSTDRTGEIADKLAAEVAEVRVVHHPVNLGLGGAYRTGFKEARNDYVSFWPADGQFPATIISKFLPLMEDADLVLGYLPHRDSSSFAKLLSWGERSLYHVLFGGFPRFQGVLMFRRELLDAVPLESTGRGWTVLMEFIIRVSRGGYRLRSVPTEMRPRAAGNSKVNNLRTILSNLKQVFELRILL